MSLFGGLSFLYPAVLLSIPVGLGLLIYAYFRRGVGKRVVVPTLLLLRTFQSEVRVSQKFFPPPRFFLELLLVLLLLLGASGLYRKQTTLHYALVLDNSLSMQAVDPTDARGRTGVALAQERARESLVELSDSSFAAVDFTVFVTSPLLRMVGEQAVSKQQALELINQVEPSSTADNLDSNVTRLLQRTDFDKVLIFSDHQAIYENSESGANKSQQLIELKPVLARAGSAKIQNVAIAEISTLTSAKAQSIQVRLQSFAEQALEVKVRLRGWKLINEKPISEELDQKLLSLSAFGSSSVIFDSIDKTQKYLEAELELRGSSISSKADAIAADNHAYLTLGAGQSQSTPQIVIVSHFTGAELGLQRIKNIPITAILPQEYEKRESDKSGNPVQAYLFHRYLPSQMPAENLALVMPPSGSNIIEVGAEVPQADVTSWSSTHPLLTYLQVSSLSLRNVTPLTAPFWGQTVLSTNAGAVGLVGEREGKKIVALGFELFPYEGKNSPLLSVLTLNLFKWLAESPWTSGYSLLPYSLPLGAEQQKLLSHFGSTISAPKKENAQSQRLDNTDTYFVDRAGLYWYREATGRYQVVALNSFDESESDTRNPLKLTIPQNRPVAQAAVEEQNSLVHILAMIVFIFLIADLLFSTWCLVSPRGKVA